MAWENEESDNYLHIEVDPKQSLLRIDKFLTDHIANASRSKIWEGIKSGRVRVNGLTIKPNYKVRGGDTITMHLPEPFRQEEVIPQDIPLNIAYEDNDLLVVNKAAGMVVHPAYQNRNGTLVNALAGHFQQLPELPGNVGRPGLVHRIDKDTSGLLVIAKSEQAMSGLAAQFFNHSIDRIYYALVWGSPHEPVGTIDVNLGRSPKDRRISTTFSSAEQGQRAVTHYEVLEDLFHVSLVKCTLETGRTHQIRAHMKHLGHPVFNDAAYGGNRILKGMIFTKYKQFVQNCFKLLPRQALHAKTIGFIHPVTNRSVQFDSELPTDFAQTLEKWRGYAAQKLADL